MSPEQQRIAIAEWCGVRPNKADLHLLGGDINLWWHHQMVLGPKHGLCPDYLNDLNAMHEAEGRLMDDTVRTYEAHLNAAISQGCRVCDFSLYASDKIWNATAAQRAEALLKTIGKWIE